MNKPKASLYFTQNDKNSIEHFSKGVLQKDPNHNHSLTDRFSHQWELAMPPLDWCEPANCSPRNRWHKICWDGPPSPQDFWHADPPPLLLPNYQIVIEASCLHTVTEFSAAQRSMWLWDKLGWGEFHAVDRTHVNILLLLLLVAVKSKLCLWCEASACGCEGLRPTLCGPHCVVSQATRQNLSPEVIACSSGAVCRPLPHFTISTSRKRETSYS